MSNGPEDSNAAGWNVELSAETADKAEELLRDLATDAELEMAVLVERSGGMIAGVATRQDVDVSTVGALVAGAFGAMGALAGELGESKVEESLHHGSGDTVYLREVASRFVLLGVAPISVPSGLVREKGAQVAGKLTALLNGSAEAAEEPDELASAPAIVAGGSEPISANPVLSPEPAAEPTPQAAADPSPFQSAETGPVAPESPVAQSSEVAETPSFHTEISVEDDHAIVMPSMNADLRPAEPAPEESEPPPKEESGGNPSYVFEIG